MRRMLRPVTPSHVPSGRLVDLVLADQIVNQPEWKHIKKCPDCGHKFVILISQVDKTKVKVFRKR